MAFWGFNWFLSRTSPPLLAGAFSLTAFLSGPLFFTGLIRMAVDGWKGPFSRWFIAPLAAICVLHPLYVLVGRTVIEREWSLGVPLLADHRGDVIFAFREFETSPDLSRVFQRPLRFSAIFVERTFFRSDGHAVRVGAPTCVQGCARGQIPSSDAITVTVRRARLMGVFPVFRLDVEDGLPTGRSIVIPGTEWIYAADLIPFTMSFGCVEKCEPITLRFLPRIGLSRSTEAERMMVEGL